MTMDDYLGVAHGVGALPPLRLLPRERRRLRRGRHHRRARRRYRQGAGGRPGRGAKGALRGFGHGQYSNVGMPDDDYASAGAAAGGGAAVGRRPGSGPATSTWPRSTTTSPASCCSAWRTSGSAPGARAGPIAAIGALVVARRGAAHQHPRGQPVRGLHPRPQPRGGRGAPAAGRVDVPGRGGRDLPRHERGGRAHERAGAGAAMTERWFPDEMPMPAANAETVRMVGGRRRPPPRGAALHRVRATAPSPRPGVPGAAAARRRSGTTLPGTGTVYTYTVVRQAFIPPWRTRSPTS